MQNPTHSSTWQKTVLQNNNLIHKTNSTEHHLLTNSDLEHVKYSTKISHISVEDSLSGTADCLTISFINVCQRTLINKVSKNATVCNNSPTLSDMSWWCLDDQCRDRDTTQTTRTLPHHWIKTTKTSSNLSNITNKDNRMNKCLHYIQLKLYHDYSQKGDTKMCNCSSWKVKQKATYCITVNLWWLTAHNTFICIPYT